LPEVLGKLQEAVLIYQRAEHQSYRSGFGAVTNKLAIENLIKHLN